MKLEQVTGTKKSIISIGEATNTIKEFIKQGIIRTVKGKFYLESTAGSGLSYFSGAAPSSVAGPVVPPPVGTPLVITLDPMVDAVITSPATEVDVPVNGTTDQLTGNLEYRVTGADVLNPTGGPIPWRPFAVTDGTFARLCPLGPCTDAVVEIRDAAFPTTVVTSNTFSVTVA